MGSGRYVKHHRVFFLSFGWTNKRGLPCVRVVHMQRVRILPQREKNGMHLWAATLCVGRIVRSHKVARRGTPCRRRDDEREKMGPPRSGGVQNGTHIQTGKSDTWTQQKKRTPEKQYGKNVMQKEQALEHCRHQSRRWQDNCVSRRGCRRDNLCRLHRQAAQQPLLKNKIFTALRARPCAGHIYAPRRRGRRPCPTVQVCC